MPGELVIVAIAAVWPVGATIAAGARRGRAAPWRPFAVAGVAGALTGVVLGVIALIMLETNGTTRAMASLGPQIGAAACLAGAVLCGLVAGVLRLTGGARAPDHDTG